MLITVYKFLDRIITYCIKKLYKNDMDKIEEQPMKFTTQSGEEYEIPLMGSLGLLGLGYQGLMAWRAKRVAHLEAQKNNNKKVAE